VSDVAMSSPDGGKARDGRYADQHTGLLQAKFHQRNKAWTASDQLRLTPRCLQPGQSIIQRCRALVFECGGNHAWPPRMMRHSFSGRSIMSMCLTPNSLSASTAAATMQGVEPSVPASPIPFAPNGFTGVGVTVLSSSKRGKSVARGMA